MQFNDALQRLRRLHARLDGLRDKSQSVPASLGETLSDVSSELNAIEKFLEEKSSADKSQHLFLEKILNSFTDPLFVKDRRHRYVLINAAESRLAGRRPEEMIGKTCYDFFPKEQADIFWEKDEAVFTTGRENVNEEYMTDGRGIVRTMVTKKTLYVDEAGNQFLVGIARDITERKKVDEQLQRAHDELEKRVLQRTADLERANQALTDTRDSLDKIINSIGDPVHVKNRQHRIILVNDASCRLFNRSREEILGRTAYELFSSSENARISWQKDEEVFTSGVENVNEETNTYAPGVTRTVLVKKTPYRDKSGNEFLVGVSRDITDRKRAEEALRESEERYRQLSEDMPVFVSAFLPDGTLTYLNKTLAAWKDQAPEDMIGKNFFEFLSPTDHEKVREILGALTPQQPIEMHEQRYLRQDGRVVYHEWTNRAFFNEQGRPIRYQAVGLDITDRKRAEEALQESEKKYSLLINNANESIIVAQDGLFKFVNPMTLGLLGAHSEQELIDRPFPEFVHPDDRRMVVENYRRRIANEVAPLRYAFRVLTAQGIVKWVEINARLIEWQGRPATLNLLTDITEKKQAEDRLIEAKEAAEAAVRSKSDFLANMSHEIRTPLNAVLGLTGLLLSSDLTAQERDYVETVRSSGNTLLSVINDILDYSKIEGGKMELESQPFHLRECIAVAVDLVKAAADQKGLAIKYELDQSIPEYFKGDVTRLRQVLVNLLGNAVKFTHDGTIDISVIGKPIVATDGKQYELHFSISDTGIGIPEEKLDRLFQSFSQVDSTTTRKYGGTGLGLAISRKLVELMAGEIWVVSKMGLGSTFHFTIQVEEAEMISNPADPGVMRPREVANPKMVRPLRILLAEDNAVNQMVAIQMLKRLGYSADVAGNGLEVLQAIERQPYDVVLMDVQMPEMDGLVAAQEIRKLWPRGPRIIAITAYALKGDRERCLAAGMDDYISKPIVIEELRRVLEKSDEISE